jgi:hypothetical protein
LFVNGLKGNTIAITLPNNATIREFKQAIHKRKHIPPGQQRLTWGLTWLEDDMMLVDYNILEGGMVQLNGPGLRGGMLHETSGRCVP